MRRASTPSSACATTARALPAIIRVTVSPTCAIAHKLPAANCKFCQRPRGPRSVDAQSVVAGGVVPGIPRTRDAFPYLRDSAEITPRLLWELSSSASLLHPGDHHERNHHQSRTASPSVVFPCHWIHGRTVCLFGAVGIHCLRCLPDVPSLGRPALPSAAHGRNVVG